MKIKKIEGKETSLGPISNTFIIISNGKFCVVDPSHSLVQIREVLGDFLLPNQDKTTGDKLILDKVIVTHCHFDHVEKIQDFIESDIPIVLSRKCYQNLQSSSINYSCMLNDKPLEIIIPKHLAEFPQDNKIILCDEIWEVIDTPGHTNCSISIYKDPNLFVGDVMFAGNSFGRYDLPTGDRRELVKTLEKLEKLPSSTMVHPGHGEDFKLAEWRK